MIEQVIERWHRHLAGNLPGGLDALLHPDVIFLSPVVFAPQRGRDITKLYLLAASQVLPGELASSGAVDGVGSKFRYVKEILDGNHAVLEFETSIGDVTVNGIDMITCDDDAMITEFKVMIRPKNAMEAVHTQVKAMLESFAAAHE